MKILFLSFVFLVASLYGVTQSSIYSFKVDSVISSNQIDFSSFRGKKILIIYEASQDSSLNQLPDLKQLSLLYPGLVMVVFPTNSFNSEPGDNSSIAGIHSGYGLVVAAKANVAGVNANPLYQWLTKQTQNRVMDSQVKRPGYKYLINSAGELVGVFSQRVRPMHDIITNAINQAK